MSDNSQLELIREAANRPPYKQTVYVNAGQLLAEIEREYVPKATVKGHSFRWLDAEDSPEPEVLDADGVPIRVGDMVWAVGQHVVKGPLNVTAVELGVVSYETEDGRHGMYFTIGDITHKQPDSLERIEADALMASIDYCNKYGLLDSRCNAEEGDEAIRHCTDCGLTCETRMVKHILRRQREVLERGR